MSLSDDPMKSKRFKINDLLLHIFNELPEDFTFTEENFKVLFTTLTVMHQTIEQAESEFIAKQPKRLLFGEWSIFDCLSGLIVKSHSNLDMVHNEVFEKFLKIENPHSHAIIIWIMAMIHEQVGKGIKIDIDKMADKIHEIPDL